MGHEVGWKDHEGHDGHGGSTPHDLPLLRLQPPLLWVLGLLHLWLVLAAAGALRPLECGHQRHLHAYNSG